MEMAVVSDPAPAAVTNLNYAGATRSSPVAANIRGTPVMRDVLSHLPVKMVRELGPLFASEFWLSTVMEIDDEQLLPQNGEQVDLIERVGSVLSTQDGPFPTVRLTNLCFQPFGVQELHCIDDDESAFIILMSWFNLFNSKKVTKFIFLNRAQPTAKLLFVPENILKWWRLETLYLCQIRFKDPSGTIDFHLPNLAELGIVNCEFHHDTLMKMVAQCPKLERLSLAFLEFSTKIHFESNSLKRMVLWNYSARDSVRIVAPKLCRLILHNVGTSEPQPHDEHPDPGDHRTMVLSMNSEIDMDLEVLGYIDLNSHVPLLSEGQSCKSVRTLGVQLGFGHDNEFHTMRRLLKYFPSVENLYIQSTKLDNVTIDLTEDRIIDLFEPIEDRKIMMVVYEAFKGSDHELCLASVLLQRLPSLQKMTIFYDREISDLVINKSHSSLQAAMLGATVELNFCACPESSWTLQEALNADHLASKP